MLRAAKVRAHSVISFQLTGARQTEAYVEPASAIDLSWFAAYRDGDAAWRLLPESVDAETWMKDWEQRAVIPASKTPPPIAPERRHTLPALIHATARLERGAYGVGFPDPPSRIDAYELLGPSSEPLLYLAVSTGQLSNDHRAYYELLYDDRGETPILIDRRRWFYDVAGMEGLEFAPIATALIVVANVMVTLPTAVVVAFCAIKRHLRARASCCRKCNYDLSGLAEGPCPECGAPRPPAR